MAKNVKTPKDQRVEENEKIRPELNLEKWSIWQPAHSKNKQTRILKRTITSPDGSSLTSEVTVGYVDKIGTVTTEDQKTYYALIKNWEEMGRPTGQTPCSLRRTAKDLNKDWGTNTIESLSQSLKHLRSTPFIWKHSYYNAVTKETIEVLNTFNILSELKIVNRKKDGAVNQARSYYRFNDFILNNLLHNHTKPVLLSVILSFKSEIAQLLYTHLDLILANNNCYERRTKELFEDLGLEGTEYKKLSARKRILEKPLAELQGVQLSTGILTIVRLEKAKDGKDYKAVFQKRPLSLRSRASETLPEPGGGGEELKQDETVFDSQPSERGRKKREGKLNKELFERLRSGIYREDLFSIYDNLADIKTIEELVEEAAYKAVKSVFVNNDTFLREELNISYSKVPFETVSEIVREKFPYDKLPTEQLKRRDFFVGAICNAVADSLTEHFTGYC